jgi:predicted CXXCH cytochrome family protein
MRPLRIVGIAAGLFAVAVVGFFVPSSGQVAPEQPVAFSHRSHAGQNQIPCLYCHVNARRSSVAGIPSVQRDFVFFQHWPHIRAEIQCQTCHGPVETMDRMQQVKVLTMKFCVSCHRQKQASIDCAVCHR